MEESEYQKQRTAQYSTAYFQKQMYLKILL